MRLAILSDIHGNLHALEAVLADLEAQGGADRTWILGDLVAFGPDPGGCLDRIRALPQETTQVIQGNTDRYVTRGARPSWRQPTAEEWPAFVDEMVERDRNFEWTSSQLNGEQAEYLLKLGTDLSLEAPGYGWAIGFHAAPGDDEAVLLDYTPDDEILDWLLDRQGRLAFGGHTHRAMDRDLGAWRFINVGSIGLPFDEPGASYVIVTFADGQAQVDFRRVPFDVDAVVQGLEDKQHPAKGWVIRHLRNPGPPTN